MALRSARTLKIAAVAFAMLLLGLGVFSALAVAPGNAAFQRTWERTDKPVADLKVSRTWMWGPDAFTGVLKEKYAESPGGMRDVQYFDKSRMEINNPGGDQDSPWYVTNGLLVVELVTGKVQVGDNQFEVREPAANVNVAGDPDDATGPTYGTMAQVLSAPPAADGVALTQRLARNGTITTDGTLAARGVTAAQRVTVPGIDHQVASPFWAFMNSSGMVYEDGQYVTDTLFLNPFYATGYPITEAYWASVKVDAQYKDVLMQCFERRCLTYTPDNDAGWQVEAGNVGRHYHYWRFEQPGTPTATATTTATVTVTATTTPAPLPDEQLFVAMLSGENEVTTAGAGPVLQAVSTDATGAAYFFVEADGSAIRYEIQVEDIENVTAAHIHVGGPDENGPVLIPLFTPPSGTTVTPNGVLVEGEITAGELPDGWTIAELAQAMVDGELYVNVHTTEHQSGEIRGQITVMGDAVFESDLNGQSENPLVETEATGHAWYYYDAADADGADRIDYELFIQGLEGNLTAAHIHEGGLNENGPVIVPLFSASAPVPVPPQGYEVEGSIDASDLADTSVAELVYLMLTGDAYTNVHSTAYESGEIRGQIVHEITGVTGQAGTWMTELSAFEEEPPVNEISSGYFAINLATGEWALIVTGLEDPTAAHIHLGAPDTNGPVIVPLFSESETDPGVENGMLAQGTLDTSTESYAQLVYAAQTGNAYVNVHTDEHPSGEIRGQLAPAPGDVFAAALTAEEEIADEPVVSFSTGAAFFWESADGLQLHYALIVDHLDDPLAAHIHFGDAGTNGPVVALLWEASDEDPGVETGILAEGTLEEDDLSGPMVESTIQDLLDQMNDGETYVNVHTDEYNAGEIRGQINPIS